MSYRIGWFSTGRDGAARELLTLVSDNIEQGRLANLEISFVFSNRTRGETRESDLFFNLVEKLGIDLVCFSSRNFRPEMRREALVQEKRGELKLISYWRNLYDEEIIRRIDKFEVDLIVLAGYMLIVGEKLCRRYPMINLHPAAPGGPRGTWQEVIWKLIEKNVSQTGVMMHLVTPQLDAGPPVTYCTFPIRGRKFDSLWEKSREKLKRKPLEKIKREEGEAEPLFKEIRKEGVRWELPLIVHTLKALSNKTIELRGKKLMKGDKAVDGYCLNEEIAREADMR
ncbi:MAG: phosphoribosylglycinamide formyltransferase [bacterium]